MTAPNTIRRMADANPVPDPGHLHPDPADAERLFSSIERRRDEMIGTRTRPSPSSAPVPHPRPWYRRPAMVFLLTVAAALVVAVPLMLFAGGESDVTETPEPTTPAPEVTTPVPQTTVPATTLPATTIPATTVPSEAQATQAPLALEGWQLITPIADARGAFDDLVASTESGFVARSNTSAGGGIMTSLDGVEWTQVVDMWDPVGLGVPFGLPDLAANGDRIAAVITESFEPHSAGIATSTDTGNWAYTILSEGEGQSRPETIAAYGTDGFIVSGGGRMWLSTDGNDYALVHEGDPLEGGPSAAPDGQTVVLGTRLLLVTQDREIRELIPRLAGVDDVGQACTDVSLYVLAHGPAGFLGIGVCGQDDAAWISSDGFAWSQIPYDEVFGETAWLASIAASERGYVAGGNSGPDGEVRAPTVWTSPDGVDWTRVVLEATVVEDTGVLGVALHENTLVAVGWIDDEAAIWRAVLAD